ncbi:hypothetical protein BH09BAC5_BH09BAC5_26530 [soil metagenome]
MKKIVVVFSLLTSLFSYGQTSVSWENVYGQNGSECGYHVLSCLDQGYIVAGSTSSGGISDGYLVRVDSLGLVMWQKYYTGNNVDIFRSIKQLPDSGYIIAGYSNSAGTHGGYDGWVMRTDKNGDSLWSKMIGTSNWDFFYDVAPTYDGGFVLCGGTYGQGAGDEDMWFVKINGNGDTLWTKTQGGVKQDEARGIIETGDSLLATCGFTYSLADTLGDSWILRMNANGDTLWTGTAGYDSTADNSWGLCDNYSTGRIFFCGDLKTPAGDKDPYFGAYFYNGTNQFMYSSGGSGDEIFYGIKMNSVGTIAAIGVNYTIGLGNGDFFLFETKTVWASHAFGTPLIDVGYSLDFTHDNGYITCGYTNGYNSNSPNVYLVKLDSNASNTGVLAIREPPSNLTGFGVTIFPNPVQQSATVIVDATQKIDHEMEMNIFDISGRKVEIISPNEWEFTQLNSAKYSLQTDQFENGVYFYVISNKDGIMSSGKFIVAH